MEGARWKFQILDMVQNLTFLAYHTVSDGNSSPTYRWAIALHTIEVGVSLPITDEDNYDKRGVRLALC